MGPCSLSSASAVACAPCGATGPARTAACPSRSSARSPRARWRARSGGPRTRAGPCGRRAPGTRSRPCVPTDGTLVDLGRLDRILDADRASGLVKVEAGITLAALSRGLDELGLAMPNLGDIDAQTLAGALATGTHGTGARLQNLSAQVEALELVDGTGERRTLTRGRRRPAARRPHRARLARDRDRGDAALRARLPAARRRHDAPARGGPGHARRARGRARPLRVLDVPALAARAHPHQRPHRRAGRRAGAGAARGCTTCCSTTTRSSCSAAPAAASRARSPRSTGSPPRPRPAASASTSRTASSPARGSCASTRWSTRSRASTPPTPSAARARSSSATRSTSPSSCASSPPTTHCSHPRTGATPPTSPCTCSRGWTASGRSARSSG